VHDCGDRPMTPRHCCKVPTPGDAPAAAAAVAVAAAPANNNEEGGGTALLEALTRRRAVLCCCTWGCATTRCLTDEAPIAATAAAGTGANAGTGGNDSPKDGCFDICCICDWD